MKIIKLAFCMPVVVLLAIGGIIGNAGEAAGLSKEIAPDAPPEIVEKLLAAATGYLTGTGSKDVLLLADPFCENSRKAYRLLRTRLEQIRTVKILWVSVYPQKGSEVAAAMAMKMQALGKGASALETVFELATPPPAAIQKARENAVAILNEKLRPDLGEIDLQQLKPEMDQVQRNTDLAQGIGYKGTPHFIVDKRVVHGYSGPAIRILLKEGL
jgi:hypothetical protein